MREAEIICRCRDITLPDLGLEMVLGQVEHVDAVKAATSQDLIRARRAGAVSVREVQRVRERRSGDRSPPLFRPTPRKKANPSIGRGRGATPPPRNPAPIVVQAQVDLGAMREIVRTEVTGALKEVILSGGLPQSFSMGVDLGVPGGDRTAESKIPIFIPEGIVKGDTKADIQVETGESEALGVEAATKALKARKKPSTKKRSTKKKKAAETK